MDSEFHDNHISQAVTLPPLVSSIQVVLQSTPEVSGIVAQRKRAICRAFTICTKQVSIVILSVGCQRLSSKSIIHDPTNEPFEMGVRDVASLRAPADEGFAYAQFNYGVLLEKAKGIPKDESLVAYDYKLAADQGHAGAQCNYGTLLMKGNGLPMDKSLAAHYYKLAPDQGHACAQCNDGVLLQKGMVFRRTNHLRDGISNWPLGKALQRLNGIITSFLKMGLGLRWTTVM
jgi:hypothetical protein